MTNLSNLLRQRTDVWRSAEHLPAARPTVATGCELLDRHLAGGWPRGAITEVLCDDDAGALRLLMPALASLSRRTYWLVLVSPPQIPYAPGFAACGVDLSRLLLVQPESWQERLWALEQALRSGASSAVLGWPERLTGGMLRRLQLAAETGDSSGFLLRPTSAAAQASAAALRLQVRQRGAQTEVDILKRRGGWPVRGLRLATTRP